MKEYASKKEARKALRAQRKLLRAVANRNPVVILRRFAWLTPNPKINVTLHSHHGMMTLFTFDDNDAGRARASMAAKSVASISGFPLLNQENIH
jgi:hypothetical protein